MNTVFTQEEVASLERQLDRCIEDRKALRDLMDVCSPNVCYDNRYYYLTECINKLLKAIKENR